MTVSLVIPVFNEIESIPPLLEEIHAALDPLGLDYEIICVDDGSSDGSSRWLDERSATDPRLRPIHFAFNAGQSAAFAEGFKQARGIWTVTLDADGQNPPAEIPKLLEAAATGADIVAGYRAERQDGPWRLVQSKIANSVRNAISKEVIRDTGCSLKLFKTELLQDLPLFKGMHRFLPTLCRLKRPLRIVEVPVRHRPRAAGSSKYGMWNRLFVGLFDLCGVRWLQRRAVRYEVRR